MIKIDVEGGEYEVIKGLVNYLTKNNCVVIMEYLSEARKNEAHKKAAELLRQLGFSAFAISNSGTLEELNDVDGFIASLKTESENLVFKKHDGKRRYC